MSFEDYIKRILDENQKIMESLGSDYDEEGVSYWDKWGKGEETRFDAEFPIDKNIVDAVD